MPVKSLSGHSGGDTLNARQGQGQGQGCVYGILEWDTPTMALHLRTVRLRFLRQLCLMGDITSQRLFVDFASLKHSENQCVCMSPSMGPSNYGHLRCLFSGLSVTMTKSRLSPFQGFALFMRSSLHGGSLPSTGDESCACNSDTHKSLLFVSSLCSGIGGALGYIRRPGICGAL